MSETDDYEYSYSSDEEARVDLDWGFGSGDKESAFAATTVDDADSQCDMSCYISWDSSWKISSAPTTTEQQQHHSSSSTSHDLAAEGKSGIRFLDSKDLHSEMRKRVGELVEVLGLSPAAASTLLREYRYNKERLLEQYTVDSDAVLKKCGVYNRVIAPVPAIAQTCLVCFDEMDSTWSLPCGHAFCTECWRNFCASAIADGPSCVFTTCPQFACSERVTEEEFAAVLLVSDRPTDRSATNSNPPPIDPPQWIKYNTFLLWNYVDSDPLTRWCPGVYCDRVACAESVAAREGECNLARCTHCSTSFCMLCGAEPHAPVTCKDLQKWTEKLRCSETSSEMWIMANTRSCPKCLSPIEKTGGCDYMICRKCNFHFCWSCRSFHPEHFCDKKRIISTSDASGSTRIGDRHDLERYSHYHSRFLTHHEAEQVARRILQKIETSAVPLQETLGDVVEERTDWKLLHATAGIQLVECRRVLKYASVVAYFLPSAKAAARNRFEAQQQILERLAGNLSSLIEEAAPLDAERSSDLVRQTRAVSLFIKNILEYVEDGMEED